MDEIEHKGLACRAFSAARENLEDLARASKAPNAPKRMDELLKSLTELLDAKENALARLMRPRLDRGYAVYSRFGAAMRSEFPFKNPARPVPLRPAVKI